LIVFRFQALFLALAMPTGKVAENQCFRTFCNWRAGARWKFLAQWLCQRRSFFGAIGAKKPQAISAWGGEKKSINRTRDWRSKEHF
jgi:hypothetical protein